MKPLPHAPAGVAPVVAVPVKDEAERIGACLRALCAQRDAPSHRTLLFVNDTTDGTAALLRDLLPSLSMPVHVVEHRFAPGAGGAGVARRLAMQRERFWLRFRCLAWTVPNAKVLYPYSV